MQGNKFSQILCSLNMQEFKLLVLFVGTLIIYLNDTTIHGELKKLKLK